MAGPYDEYKDTPLWRSLAAAVVELEASREIAVATASDYVVGYLCQTLVAAQLAAPRALTYDP
ncbi:hypothetical protein J421_6174 (plasmid) [Gemmatirosa kalamazoonensis]|uniref:Uncharacterized protein n=1 Tax=Gemmatirosa kalamazoonensis TaxID=861299 RepID=W0RRW7_9BACT|nr:hypothetical protein [Gemmatirosa kalamazoonensis]AHG93709.1 hypothetical protein J421_6174 [Gemmatirosa kalamazoonensis]